MVAEVPQLKEKKVEKLTGTLPCGKQFTIDGSNLKAPGLVEGDHMIAVIDGNTESAEKLGAQITGQLFAVALAYGMEHAESPGKYRVAMNGGTVATRGHLHFHIMLPKGNDKLDTLVAR